MLQRGSHQLHRRRRLRGLRSGPLGADQSPVDLAGPARGVDCRAGQALRRARPRRRGTSRPRIGAAYVLTADQKHVVRASWGRVTDIPNAGYFDNAGSSAVATRDEYDVDRRRHLRDSAVRRRPARRCRRTQTRDPEKHQGYVQEWIVRLSDAAARRRDVRRQLCRSDLQGSSGQRRDQPDLRLDPSVATSCGAGWSTRRQNSITLSTNNTGTGSCINGLEFTATKQTQASQPASPPTRGPGTSSTVTGSRTIRPRSSSPTRFRTTAASARFAAAARTASATDTRNRSWQKHQFRAGVTWHAPWDLNVVDPADAAVGHPERTDRDDASPRRIRSTGPRRSSSTAAPCRIRSRRRRASPMRPEARASCGRPG